MWRQKYLRIVAYILLCSLLVCSLQIANPEKVQAMPIAVPAIKIVEALITLGVGAGITFTDKEAATVWAAKTWDNVLTNSQRDMISAAAAVSGTITYTEELLKSLWNAYDTVPDGIYTISVAGESVLTMTDYSTGPFTTAISPAESSGISVCCNFRPRRINGNWDSNLYSQLAYGQSIIYVGCKLLSLNGDTAVYNVYYEDLMGKNVQLGTVQMTAEGTNYIGIPINVKYDLLKRETNLWDLYLDGVKMDTMTRSAEYLSEVHTSKCVMQAVSRTSVKDVALQKGVTHDKSKDPSVWWPVTLGVGTGWLLDQLMNKDAGDVIGQQPVADPAGVDPTASTIDKIMQTLTQSLSNLRTGISSIANALNPASDTFLPRVVFMPPPNYFQNWWNGIFGAIDDKYAIGWEFPELAEDDIDWNVTIGGYGMLPQVTFLLIPDSVWALRTQFKEVFGGFLIMLAVIYAWRKIPRILNS